MALTKGKFLPISLPPSVQDVGPPIVWQFDVRLIQPALPAMAFQPFLRTLLSLYYSRNPGTLRHNDVRTEIENRAIYQSAGSESQWLQQTADPSNCQQSTKCESHSTSLRASKMGKIRDIYLSVRQSYSSRLMLC